MIILIFVTFLYHSIYFLIFVLQYNELYLKWEYNKKFNNILMEENKELSQEISKAFEKSEDTKLPKTSLKDKLKKFFSRKRNIFIVVSIVLLLITVIVIVVLSIILKQEEKIVVSEDIAEQEVYIKYDYVYNTEDNKLVASTIDKSKQIDLLKSNELIVDYVVSPDKKRIIYSISDKNYKSMVTSTNMDLTRVNFEPVAFKVYELNLKTGENSLIYSTGNIQLGSTSYDIYHKRLLVYPDSYVSYTDYYGNVVSYPVSYTEYIDDLDKGYMINYLPWDLSEELRRKELKLIDINDDSNKVLLAYENKLVEYDLVNKQTKDINLDGNTYNNCHVNAGGKWANTYLNISVSCNGSWQGRIYKFSGTQLEDLTSQIMKQEYPYILNLTDEYVLFREYQDNYSNGIDFKIHRFNSSTSTIVSNLSYPSGVVNVENDLGEIMYAQSFYDDSKRYDAYREYTFSSINDSDKSTELFKLELPIDINELTYLKDSNIVTYYRRFYGYGDIVIEYVNVDLETKESDELLYTKVQSSSVLSYKPKLVWLNLD